MTLAPKSRVHWISNHWQDSIFPKKKISENSFRLRYWKIENWNTFHKQLSSYPGTDVSLVCFISTRLIFPISPIPFLNSPSLPFINSLFPCSTFPPPPSRACQAKYIWVSGESGNWDKDDGDDSERGDWGRAEMMSKVALFGLHRNGIYGMKWKIGSKATKLENGKDEKVMRKVSCILLSYLYGIKVHSC